MKGLSHHNCYYSESSCWRRWLSSPENWHQQWYFGISGRKPGYRTVYGRMVLCSVLHHFPPRISAADLCRRRSSLWAGWSSRWAGLRNWSTECWSKTGDNRTTVAQDEGTADWAINISDNIMTLCIRVCLQTHGCHQRLIRCKAEAT